MKNLLIIVLSLMIVSSCCKDDVDASDSCNCSSGQICIDNKCQCPDGEFDFYGNCFSKSDNYYFGNLSCACMDTVGLQISVEHNSVSFETKDPSIGGGTNIADINGGISHFYWNTSVCDQFKDVPPFDTLKNAIFPLEMWARSVGDTLYLDIYRIILKDTCHAILVRP